jgi:predicted transcriptional regulator
MYLTDTKRAVLRALKHGPLDHYQVAADLSEAPFLIEAELKGLKREQLVKFEYTRNSRIWKLTERGERVAWGNEQLELGGRDVA